MNTKQKAKMRALKLMFFGVSLGAIFTHVSNPNAVIIAGLAIVIALGALEYLGEK